VAERSRVLLLGASGFLGAPIRRLLEDDGRAGAIIGVARAAPADGGAARWVPVDLADAGGDRWQELLAGVRPDVVINAAGRTTGGPAELQALNVTAVEYLLEALGREVPDARLVHLGSAAEYGPATAGRPTVETDEPRPAGPYGQAKLAATRAVLAAAADGLDAIVLRPFNPIGPRMPLDTMPGNAARLMAEALAGGQGSLRLGPLDAYRDFVSTDDVASAAVTAAFSHDGRGEVLNVGSGKARQARELVHVLAAVAGFAGTIEEEAAGSSRSGVVSWSEADLSRIARVLDWHPSVPFPEAVAALWPPAGDV
jgi:NDP-hexose 4-ketoreductase